MMNIKPCKYCGATTHYPYLCKLNPKKPKRIRRYGKKARAYSEWRDEVAIPYLDMTIGHRCSRCGIGGKLDIDHKLGRGSHPHLRMELSNLTYLCRLCHTKKTDGN